MNTAGLPRQQQQPNNQETETQDQNRNDPRSHAVNQQPQKNAIESPEETQKRHAKNVEYKQQAKLHSNSREGIDPPEDEELIDKAQEKVAAEFNEADLTPEQYAERTEMAAHELEDDPNPTPGQDTPKDA